MGEWEDRGYQGTRPRKASSKVKPVLSETDFKEISSSWGDTIRLWVERIAGSSEKNEL